MKQFVTLGKVKEILPKINGLNAAILYGSFARKTPNPNSDIDIQLLIDNNFEVDKFILGLRKLFHDSLFEVLFIKQRSKIVIYFIDQPKLEFALCKQLEEIERNYLGSNIYNIPESILFESDDLSINLTNHMSKLVSDNIGIDHPTNKAQYIDNLIERFMYEFESSSVMHRRSDGYQFYFFYNIALHAAIQLYHISKGETKYNFLPKYFIANTLEKEEQNNFYKLNGSLLLPEANSKKRELLDFFYNASQPIISTDKFEQVQKYCEWIFERDYWWNFRDIHQYNPRMKKGVLYRTATLSLFQRDTRFQSLLESMNIQTVIDLRANRELEESRYNAESLSLFQYVHAPWDPWNQPEWFKTKHHKGSNEEIAYRFFALGCKGEIKMAIEAILSQHNGAVAVHCFAGKDRTGIFISLLHLLVNTPLDVVYNDYLASEVDVKIHRLQLVLDIVSEHGGIEPYLLSCGLNSEQLILLKQKLSNE
jgi:protein tyrosine/serine phosphatase/predicted nucleotidyltransferase